MNTTLIRKRLNPFLMEANLAERAYQDEQKNLQHAKDCLLAVEEARKIIQAVAEAVQQKAHEQIAKVVTRCLQAVFGAKAYSFGIEFRQARGKTEAELYFEREGKKVDPTTAAGGGVVDVAAFALRLACLILSTPRKRKLLLLDEPFRMLSKEYRPRVRTLLETLSKEMDVQIVMVTHSEELVCGKVVRNQSTGTT